MCCNCNEEAPFNYSNGFQTYARPTSGPYIATTHIPSEYGPVYVDCAGRIRPFRPETGCGAIRNTNLTERSAFGSAFSHTRAGERAEIGRARKSGRREGALIGHFSRTRPNWPTRMAARGSFCAGGGVLTNESPLMPHCAVEISSHARNVYAELYQTHGDTQ